MDIFEGKSYCIWSKSSFSGSISYKSEGYSFLKWIKLDPMSKRWVWSKSATWKLIQQAAIQKLVWLVVGVQILSDRATMVNTNIFTVNTAHMMYEDCTYVHTYVCSNVCLYMLCILYIPKMMLPLATCQPPIYRLEMIRIYYNFEGTYEKKCLKLS